MLCTSGFVDGVIFSYHETNGQNQARHYV